MARRLRIFAGPNGSGKTTLAKELSGKGEFKLNVFVNADEIEEELSTEGSLDLHQFQSSLITQHDIRSFFKENGIINSKRNINNRLLSDQITVSEGNLAFHGDLNSYIASDLASFLRLRLLDEGVSFAFETVFSHESKLEFLRLAKSKGFRVYFYFLATDDPIININRVNLRVAKQGHFVPPETITERYYRSLELLYDAVKVSSRAYLFDNSGRYFELVAQIMDGKKVEVVDFDQQIPNWFIDFFYNKSNPDK